MNELNEKIGEAEWSQPKQVETSPADPGAARVYERPARSAPPLTIILVLLILAILAAILFFQFIR
jgi:hypothetical protein